MKYQVQENCLTIFLPNEIDHHNAEEVKRESDHLIERFLTFRIPTLWTVPGSGSSWEGIKGSLCWEERCVRYM